MTLNAIIKRLEVVQDHLGKTGSRLFSDSNDRKEADKARAALGLLIADLKALESQEAAT